MKVHGTRRLWAAVLLLVAAALLLPSPCHAGTPARHLGLSIRRDGVLVKDGRPYRGIGVNYFDAFYRHLVKPADTSYDAGFAGLRAAHIPFCRLAGCGFWPVDQRLYQQDRAEFFRRFDEVVRSAERHSVGLIPSLFWNTATVPDLVGEPVSAWGDPSSRTRTYMRAYVRDVVTRYRNSPAIWGWEFGNEMNLGASLPNAADHLPQIEPSLGTPARRTLQDAWTYETIRAAFAVFGREVRRYDPERIISTGDGFPRPSAWHNWKEGTWTADTPAQGAEMLRGDNPAPISVVSVHAYGGEAPRVREAARLAQRLGKPLWVGEFGSPGPPARSQAEFQTLLTAITEAQVPLAAVWVYDRAGDPFSITPTDERSYQLRAIAAANARLRAGK